MIYCFKLQPACQTFGGAAGCWVLLLFSLQELELVHVKSFPTRSEIQSVDSCSEFSHTERLAVIDEGIVGLSVTNVFSLSWKEFIVFFTQLFT